MGDHHAQRIKKRKEILNQILFLNSLIYIRFNQYKNIKLILNYLEFESGMKIQRTLQIVLMKLKILYTSLAFLKQQIQSSEENQNIYFAWVLIIIIISLNSMRKKFSEVPERELKWKKYDYLRNLDFPTFYACECGKIYSNFPAIYLHFERKHKKKIHNLHEASQFQKIMNKSQTIYLFFLRKGKTKNANEQQQTFLRSLNQIMSQFQRQCSNLTVIQENSLMTAKLFLNFIQFIYELQIRKSKQIPELRVLLSQIPNKLNNFVQSTFCEYQDEEQFKKVCRILFQFSTWLNKKKYTQLIIQMCMMEAMETTIDSNNK